MWHRGGARIIAGSFAALLAACGSTPEGETDAGFADAAPPADAGRITDAAAPDAEAPAFHVRPRFDGVPGSGTAEDPFGDLQSAIDAVPSGARLVLAPGTYTATPTAEIEELCGNCEQHQTRVQYTSGFTVRGKSLAITGTDPASIRLETRAGYGLLIEGAGHVQLSNLVITGGVRDEAGEATSAAIVVRDSTVDVSDVTIAFNESLRAGNAYPGIAGIAGREGARLKVWGSTINRNGWDGIVLYRGARATVVNNFVGNGNGTGIAATWDADLTVINNRVTGYWKGIGGFGKSAVIARNNQVWEQSGWGIWAAGDEDSTLEAINNVIVSSGNCGLVVGSSARGRAVNNIIAFHGTQDPWVCPKTGVWLFAPLGPFRLSYNTIHGNPLAAVWRGGAQPAGDGGEDVSAEVIGVDGNAAFDPSFAGARDFALAPGSPAIDAGDPAILDRDGTRSDLGHLGGPDAERMSLDP